MKSYTKILLAFGVMAIACMGLLIVENDTEESDAATTASMTVGQYFSSTIIPGSTYVSGTIPGITIEDRNNAGLDFVYAYGTPTRAGTYTIVGSLENCTVTVNDAEPITYTHTLRYNANGGSGAPSTQTYTGTSTSAHTFTISSTVPTRTGMTFTGWSTSSTASTASYQPGGTISVPANVSRTLYAIWEQYTTVTMVEGQLFESVIIPSAEYISGTIPGMTISDVTNAGLTSVYASGTPTTAGSYIITAHNAANNAIIKCTVTVTEGSYTCNLIYNANGGSGAPSTQTYTGTSTSAHTFTISSTVPTRTGMTFIGWSTSSTSPTASYQPGGTISVEYYETVTLYAVWMKTVSTSMTVGEAYNRVIIASAEYISGTIPGMTISDVTNAGLTSVYASGTPTTAGSYTILARDSSYTAFVQCNVTVEEAGPTDVYWSNDMYNGSVSIAFRFSGGSSNMDHHMSIPLYVGETNESQETEWTDTGKELQLTITYPSTVVILKIVDGSTTLLGPTTINVGMWKAFVLTLNTDRGQMTFTPIDVFTNFTDYTTLDDKTKLLADWSSIIKGNTIHEIIHTETGTGAPVSMQVVNTDTFLNTFGVVLTNPSINVFDYFPDLTSARLNFYAFALYGDSMTVNGTTLPVDDTGKVQVTYTSNSRDTEHWIASPGTEGAKTSSFTLSNIYITWQDGNVSLTFVDDRFTVDLGAYSAGDESVSFTGYWYFTTMLNEPYQTTEKVITGDWHTLPTIGGPAMLLVFLGVILIGGMIAHVKIGLKWLDFVILGMGLIVTFTLLG